jgi:hypothetical protein
VILLGHTTPGRGIVRRGLFVTSICAVLLFTAAPIGHAASTQTRVGPAHPTWWAKYLAVSSQAVRSSIGTRPASVSVGTNVDVSNEEGPQSETSIAIDPSAPSRIVAGSNEISRLPMRAYFSSDGGATWGGVDLPLPPPINLNGFDFGSDPGVAWDTHGNVFYSYIVVFFSATGKITGSEVAVARSADGGHTWRATFFNQSGGHGKFNDKPMITVDTGHSSPFRDTVYVAWDTTVVAPPAPSSTGVKVSRSADGGRTFSAPVDVSPTGGGQRFGIGADPFVAPDGTLHVAWTDLSLNIEEAASTNGGASFDSPHVISPINIPIATAIPAQNSRGVLVTPACGADVSSGPDRGTLYCSWFDANGTSGLDVFVSRSTDGGVSWGSPVVVNDDPAGEQNDQFFQWLAVDPVTGSVDLSWYDTRLDPTHVSTNVFFSNSSDGGLTFAPNARVTTASTDETVEGADLGNQYGDYEGIAAFGGFAHPVWTDRRASLPSSLNEEVFTATISTT